MSSQPDNDKPLTKGDLEAFLSRIENSVRKRSRALYWRFLALGLAAASRPLGCNHLGDEMTPQEIENELRHLATKEELQSVRADLEKALREQLKWIILLHVPTWTGIILLLFRR